MGARGAPESAAELVEWARTVTPPEMTVDIQRRTVQAAEYRFHAGELRTARELLEAVLEGAPAGPTRAVALRLLGEICYHERSVPEAVFLFVEALDQVNPFPRLIRSALPIDVSHCAAEVVAVVRCELREQMVEFRGHFSVKIPRSPAAGAS